MEIIGSKDNKLAKRIKSLYTKEGRENEGAFVIEGLRNVRDAIEKGADIDTLILREDMDGKFEAKKGKTVFVTKKLYDYLSETVTPQGVMAICRIKETKFSDIELKKDSLIVVCENLQDPGNAGTIIRTADACGAAGVIMTKGCVDIYNPKTARALMSSIFSVKVVRNKPLDAIFAYLDANGIKSFAGALKNGAKNIFETDMSGRCAIFIGNEGRGLSDLTVKRCGEAVMIPILGGAESLNASSAAAVMMYEHVRQNMGGRKNF